MNYMNCKIFSKKITIFFLCFFAIIPFVNADSCKYQGKIDECTQAIVKFIGREPVSMVPGGRIKSITDFPCIQHNPEMRAMQIIMDDKFSKIDNEMNKFLNDLYTSKDFYFSKNGDFDILDAVDQIETLTNDF